MNDDFQSKTWAEQHGSFSTDMHKLFGVIGKALKRLNAIQYDAPWRRDITDSTHASPGANRCREC